MFAMAPRPDYDMDGEYVERSDEERRAIVSNQGSFGPRKDGGPLVQEISLMVREQDPGAREISLHSQGEHWTSQGGGCAWIV